MITNVLHRWADIERLQRGEMVLPHFVDFHTSNLCNQHCVGCAYDGTLDKQMMKQADHFRIVNDFISLGVHAFDFAGGGEPTTLPYLAKLMSHITERKAYFALITNGTLLSADLINALIAGATYVRVSLEASNPKDYSTYKEVPEAHWTRAIENIRTLIEEKRKANSPVEISVKFAVGKSLRGAWHYLNSAELARSLGVDRFTMKALRHEPEELSEAEKIEEQAICDKVMADSGMNGLCHSWIAPFPANRIGQCYLNQLHTMVDHRGDCWICCYHYFRMDRHFLGNILERDFIGVWFSQDHKSKVAAIDMKECQRVDCKFFKWHDVVDQAQRRGAVYWL